MFFTYSAQKYKYQPSLFKS